MRSAILAVPLVAAVAYGAHTASGKGYTLVPELSGTVTVTSTYRYNNPATAYLTETNSAGVITGEPGQSTIETQPAAVTSQPQVATIPAGISGTRVITINGTSGLTSFTVSGGKKTTEILGGAQVSTAGASSGMEASSGGASPTGHGHNGGGASGNGNGNSGSGASSSSSSTGGAAPTGLKVAGAGVIGLGAFVAALL